MQKYLYKTSYLKSPWTWVFRFGEFLIVLLAYFAITSADAGFSSSAKLVKYLLVIAATCYIIGRPKDELAIDGQYLYYIRQSVVPFITSCSKFPLRDIKHIGVGSIYNDDAAGFLDTGKRTNSLEIVFIDNSSKLLWLTIDKVTLKWMSAKAIFLIRQMRSEKSKNIT